MSNYQNKAGHLKRCWITGLSWEQQDVWSHYSKGNTNLQMQNHWEHIVKTTKERAKGLYTRLFFIWGTHGVQGSCFNSDKIDVTTCVRS